MAVLRAENAAPLWFWLVADWPSEASWVSAGERDYIESTIVAERREAPEVQGYGQVIRSGVVWQLVAVYFLIQVGFYGINLWLPTLVENVSQQTIGTVGWLTAIPYVVAIVGLWLNGWAADKDGRYSLHVFVAMLLGAVALVSSVLVGSDAAAFSIALISLATCGALAYDGPFWASASAAMPAAVAGGAMGLINAIGNLGGFAGPYIGGYLQDHSGGSFVSTATVLAGALLLAGLVMLTVRVRQRRAQVASAT